MSKVRVTISMDEQDRDLLDQIAEKHDVKKIADAFRKLCESYRTHQENAEFEDATRTANHDTILEQLNLNQKTDEASSPRWSGINK